MVPAATPVTMPVNEPIVAVAGVTDDQIPPPATLLNVVVPEGQVVAVPVMVPAFGEGLTVTIVVVAAVPQAFVTVYDIVVVPVATPVTMPLREPIVAVAGVTDVHTPPPVALLRVVVAEGHTVAVPVIVPADGSALTVVILVA